MKNTREHDKKWIETLQERNRVLNELLQLTQIENEELKEQLTLTDVVKSDSEQFTPNDVKLPKENKPISMHTDSKKPLNKKV